MNEAKNSPTFLMQIKNLHAKIDGKTILNGINLNIKPGEIHAIMGPNGAGKSTLAKILAGHPSYEVTEGEVWFQEQNILELDPEERARLGLFMSFQYPPEITGISNVQFLHHAFNAVRKSKSEEDLSEEAFNEYLDEKMNFLEMRAEFKNRSVNEGFSGGEKKRNEILQMAILNPLVSILDETDSGLDIDAMRIIANGIKKLMDSSKGLILITHYQRLLDYIEPDFVHVLKDGKIVQSGTAKLALQLEAEGYDKLARCVGDDQ